MPGRATFAIVITVVGLFLLFNFKTPDIATTHPAIALPSPSPAPHSSSTPTPAGGTPNPQPSQSLSPTPTTSGLRDGTYTGQDYSNQYGDVQVSVTVSGGSITDVQPIQMPMDRQRSAQISQQAGPLLHDEVLQAQSAQIDGISGATFTSESYAQSVQSALDKA